MSINAESTVEISIYCSFCQQDLTDINGLFCPSCGHTIFKNAVFNSKSKTTSTYDPLGIYTKPWKDKPLIKARVYPAAKGKPQPWYPTMRQARRPKKMKTVLKKAEDSSTIVTEETKDFSLFEMESTVAEIEQGQPETENPLLETVIGNVNEEDLEPKIVLESIKERISPLAAYDLSHEDKKFTAFISLVENVLGEGSSKCYWLKVALLVEKASNEDTVGNNEEGEFVNLGFLSNESGRFLIPNSDDWVELTSIDAREYYMAQHMQKVLSFLCGHVRYRVDFSTTGDLVYLVEGRDLSQTSQFKMVEHVDEYGRVLGGKQTLQLLCKHLGKSSDEGKPEFILDDVIANIKGSIRLSRSSKFPYCPVMIHVRVEYRNSTVVNRSNLKHKITREDFIKMNEATHLIIRIQPDVQKLNLSESIPYGNFTFDHVVLNHMLKGERSLNTIIESSCENMEVLENYITRITNMLRLDYTDKGIQYSLVGAFAEPCFTSFPWPEDIEDQLSKYAELDFEITPIPTKPREKCTEKLDPPLPALPSEDHEIIEPEEEEKVEEPVDPVEEVVEVEASAPSKPEPIHEVADPCPFHGAEGCACALLPTALRGTKIQLYADFGDYKFKGSVSEVLKDVQENGELFLAAVDVSGNKDSYLSEGTYLKGKVSMATLKNPRLSGLISEYLGNLDEIALENSIEENLIQFMEDLLDSLDLFKSDAHKFMKLTVKM